MERTESEEADMAAPCRLVAFPLIIAWRPEFWSLPLYFPDLRVGVLWQWPQGLPYQGMALPAAVAAGGRELKHYAPGELTQWQAFQQYAESGEEVEDLVRVLRGEPAKPRGPEGPWPQEDVWRLAWQLEFMAANQDAALAKVDRDGEGLAELLSPEPWEEQGVLAATPGEIEMLDPETARLGYLLWRREMKAHLGAGSTPLLLGRTSSAIFASLRKEAGGPSATPERLTLPGCRTAEEFRAARGEGPAPPWQEEFETRLADCLQAATEGTALAPPIRALARWLEGDLARQWPGNPSLSWELEIWAREPKAGEGGEALLGWGGLGKEVVPG